jgi:hypothetical protein
MLKAKTREAVERVIPGTMDQVQQDLAYFFMCPQLHGIGKFVPVHAIKAYGKMGKWLFSFLTLALDGGNQ